MTSVLNRYGHPPPPSRPLLPTPAIDEAPARRALRRQIGRMEAELSGLVVSAFPRVSVPETTLAQRGPRVLALSELEELRDELSERLTTVRRALDQRGREEQEMRRLREEMLLEPERYRWVRVSNQDIGEPGCEHWHVRPRFGLLGMLMNWWRVKISSGCP